MAQLRVLIVAHQCAPSIGGIQSFIDGLGRRLIRDHVDVKVAAIRMASTQSASQAPYNAVYGPGWIQAWRLMKWADIVQFSYFDYEWWLLAKLLRKRVIFIYHSHSRTCPKGVSWNGKESCSFNTHRWQCPGCLRQDRSWLEAWGRWFSFPVKRWLIDRADVVVNISKYTQQRFQIPGSRTILMGIDLGRFRPSGPAARNYFLFAGRLIPEKGCQILLEAFAQCVKEGCQIPLIIVGDGPYRAALEAQTHELGILNRVTFEGTLTGEPFVKRLQHALAVVVPSIGPEAWGRVPLEAVGCGTPVIVAASGGLEDVGDAGLRYPRLNHAALAEHMMRLLNDNLLREQLQAAGRALIQRYDVERMVSEYRELYRELANGTGETR